MKFEQVEKCYFARIYSQRDFITSNDLREEGVGNLTERLLPFFFALLPHLIPPPFPLQHRLKIMLAVECFNLGWLKYREVPLIYPHN